MQLTLLYALFAGISMAANLGSQAAVAAVYHGLYPLLLAIIVGTGVGLLVKYVLDKRWIFCYTTENMRHDARLFLLYTTMGLATTIIFWGTEFAFDRLFGTPLMRYFGGALGLVIGYFVKYRLDKAFVFAKSVTAA